LSILTSSGAKRGLCYGLLDMSFIVIWLLEIDDDNAINFSIQVIKSTFG